MSKFLVTGGAGFIGSNIVEELLLGGKSVRVLDDFSSGKKANLLPFQSDVELIEGSVQDIDKCREAVKDVEVVFHQAAIPSVPKSISNPILTHGINLTGSLNVLTACKEMGVRRLVFASSSAIYGDAPELPKCEDMFPKPISPYALHKLSVEHYNRLFSSLYGLEAVSLRYFNVFGPRQDPKSEYAAVIPKFISMMLSGKAPTIYGDGKQTRDFIYVKDVAKANLKAAYAKVSHGEVINIARGGEIDLLTLIKDLNSVLGTKFEPVFCPAQLGDIPKSTASIEKMKRILDFSPIFDFKSGLAQTVKFYHEAHA
ncbi:MAG: SDR family oxidoreductase [Candidatus Riflebacteria bacterium]|nr:SDR family oxidoreductase [Candidatus Riflebacteria bacterium]